MEKKVETTINHQGPYINFMISRDFLALLEAVGSLESLGGFIFVERCANPDAKPRPKPLTPKLINPEALMHRPGAFASGIL